MRLLVTGANGFLGRALQPLLPPAWDVAALLRVPAASGGYPRGYASIGQLLAGEQGFDAVLHLAAQIAVPAAGPTGYLAANVGLPSTLVQAYPDARHVLASSVSVFGGIDALPVTMRTPCSPEHPYGRSKLAGEHVVAMAPSHAIVRFSSLLGRGMQANTFVPRIIADARSHRRITLLGTGERLQNYLDVRDAAAMCLRALEATGNFATLGIGARAWSNREVAAMVASRLGAGVVSAGSDPTRSCDYALTGSVDLGENMRPLEVTLDWLVEQ